jgi:hypothetical protein
LQFLPSLLGGYVQPEGLKTLSSTFSGDRIELRNLVIKPEVGGAAGECWSRARSRPGTRTST